MLKVDVLLMSSRIILNDDCMTDFWRCHDTTDNKCTETQLILVHLYTKNKRYFISLF